MESIRRLIRRMLFRWVALNEQDVKEFQAKFPGKCMVCSFQRYGYMMGYENSPTAEPHVCIEQDKEG